MFAVYEEDLSFAIQPVFFIVRVIDEACFVAQPSGIDTPFAV